MRPDDANFGTSNINTNPMNQEEYQRAVVQHEMSKRRREKRRRVREVLLSEDQCRQYLETHHRFHPPGSAVVEYKHYEPFIPIEETNLDKVFLVNCRFYFSMKSYAQKYAS